MLHIVTDGSADMPSDWPQKYQIHILPLMVRFGEELYVAGENLTHEQFYRLVAERGMIPHSSLPAPDQIIAFYRKIARPGDEILSIHIASKMSGTFSAVQIATHELIGELKITVFDSGAGSAALGFMCREARLLHQTGFSAREIIRRLDEARQKLTIIFTVENLEYARLSGRVNFLQSTLSSLLGIKPIIVLRDGLLQMAEKVRTRGRAIDRVLESVFQRISEQAVNIAIVHAADLDTAKAMVEKVRSWANVKEIIITDLAIPVAANLGPGTIGVVAYPVNGG